jgi:hypothetical protein
MVICGSYIFEFSVSKGMKQKNNNNRRIPTYLLAFHPNTNCQGFGN